MIFADIDTSWLSLKTVQFFEKLAEQQKVSVVARGKNGFIEHYKATNGKPYRLHNIMYSANQSWWQRRRHFVRRHLAQANNRNEKLWRPDGQPTRRHLALIMWAYSPDPHGLERYLRKYVIQ
jgi:hypothetical protein